MKNICDLEKIFSIFLILFITTVSPQNLSPVLCGGLHSGVNPCKENSDSQSVLVKAQALPKPLVVETAANQLTPRPMRGWRNGLKFPKNLQASNKRRPHLRNSVAMDMKSISSERPARYIPQVQQVQQVQQEIPYIDPNIKLAPKFHPIGDLCLNKKENKPEPVRRSLETNIVTPANLPKIECYTESSPVIPLGSSGMLNMRANGQVILDDSGVPQISSGSSRTRFRVNGPRRYNKPRGGSIGVDRPLNINPTSSNIKIKDHTVNFNAPNLNPVRTNGLMPNVMRSGAMIDNPINRGINVYPGNSAVGVSPIASTVQRMPYSLTPGASIPLNTQERMYNGESVPSDALENHPADLVSVNIMYNHMLESYLRAAANAGGINPTSAEKIHEGKLAFGPQKIPIDDQVKVTFKEIPEEKLHIVEKPVIELKLNQPPVTSHSSEEPAPFISYGDLGFQEKTSNSPKFQDISDVSEVPKINPKQRIDAEIEPEYFHQYLKPSTVVTGQLVPIKLGSSEYLPTKPLLRSNMMNSPSYVPSKPHLRPNIMNSPSYVPSKPLLRPNIMDNSAYGPNKPFHRQNNPSYVPPKPLPRPNIMNNPSYMPAKPLFESNIMNNPTYVPPKPLPRPNIMNNPSYVPAKPLFESNIMNNPTYVPAKPLLESNIMNNPEYAPTETLESNIMDNPAHQLIPLPSSHVDDNNTHGPNYGFIIGPQKNNKQLTTANNPMLSPLNNHQICYCY